MNRHKKNQNLFSSIPVAIVILLFCLQLPAIKTMAGDDKKASIRLNFIEKDSTRTCKAIVTSDNAPVKGTEIHFYVKRMYNPLPIGKAIQTDENGEATATFPMNLPGDEKGNFTVIAKIEDDDTYGSAETKADVKWGSQPGGEKDTWSKRSLSASREKAPMYLIIASNLIIAVIWGTIFYVVFQIFRIRKESRLLKKDN